MSTTGIDEEMRVPRKSGPATRSSGSRGSHKRFKVRVFWSRAQVVVPEGTYLYVPSVQEINLGWLSAGKGR